MYKLLLTVLVSLAFAAPAMAHVPVVNQTDVITWTHPNHRNDEVGAAACEQTRPLPPFRLGITKCITTTNRIYKYRSAYPQVGKVPNPVGWDSKGSLIIPDTITGTEWWYTRAASSVPGGPSGIAIYEARRPFLSFKPAWVVVTPLDASLLHPLDGDAPGRTFLPRPVTYDVPPPDFIR